MFDFWRKAEFLDVGGAINGALNTVEGAANTATAAVVGAENTATSAVVGAEQTAQAAVTSGLSDVTGTLSFLQQIQAIWQDAKEVFWVVLIALIILFLIPAIMCWINCCFASYKCFMCCERCWGKFCGCFCVGLRTAIRDAHRARQAHYTQLGVKAGKVPDCDSTHFARACGMIDHQQHDKIEENWQWHGEKGSFQRMKDNLPWKPKNKGDVESEKSAAVSSGGGVVREPEMEQAARPIAVTREEDEEDDNGEDDD